jgi:hypothetical protein
VLNPRDGGDKKGRDGFLSEKRNHQKDLLLFVLYFSIPSMR